MAAIQSINVCRQTLEKDESIGIGRIITPSLILHGSFDFTLMLISFLADVRIAREEQNDFEIIDDEYGLSLAAFCIGLTICVLGIVVYFWESDKQKARLDALERSTQTLIS